MYALSTSGSIIGTFLPVAVLIPAIGTRRTMLATACLLALAASPVLGRRYLAVPALIGAVALVPPGAVKPGSHIIYEGESAYQFVQVQSLPGGGRVLHLNEGWADHSVVPPGPGADRRLLGSVPARADPARPGLSEPQHDRLRRRDRWPGVRHLLAVGQRARHRARPAGHRCGRRYFGLASNPRVRVATADGRVYLEQHHTRYDAVFLDAFRQPYIPFYLTTQEFWSLARDRLDAGRHGDGERRPHPGRRRACRMRSRGRWRPGSRRSSNGASSGFNDIVAGFTSPTTAAELRARLADAPAGAAARRGARRSSSGWSPPRTIL